MAATQQLGAERVVIEAIMDEREKKRKSKKMKKWCIGVFKFFLSTAGLLILNGLVMALGGFIFENLETENEIQGCKNSAIDYFDAENATLILLMDKAQQLDGISTYSAEQKQELVNTFQDHLRQFSLSVLDTGHDYQKDCDLLGTPEGEELDWSFRGSLVFAVTVVTTIGKP